MEQTRWVKLPAPRTGTLEPLEDSSAGRDRWKLLRALGAIADDPGDARAIAAVLDLPACGNTEHTEVFVFNCPPYASVYLGPGGEGPDGLAGFWRAIGLAAPAEPDHLTALLSLYASLGEAAEESRQPPEADALSQLREDVFREYLWPWLPAYLGAVWDLPATALVPWAELTLRALRRERVPGRDGPLPLALREAQPPVTVDLDLGDLLGALITPIRSGLILTRRAVSVGADRVGAGQRIGERRSALRAMFEQQPDRTAAWLADEATRWSWRHLAVAPGDPVQQWWADRAESTARVLLGERSVSPAD
jgi:hypothetical protein